jgi:Flp pilus assembly protein TadD
VQQASSRSVRAARLSRSVRAAGLESVLVGWPATRPAPADEGHVIAGGVEDARGSTPGCWPLAPDAIEPVTLRDELAPLRVHPLELDADIAFQMLTACAPAEAAGFSGLIRGTLASCVTLHMLGSHLQQAVKPNLLAIRFNMIAAVAGVLVRLRPIDDWHARLRTWYRFVDQICARYVELSSSEDTIIVISNGLPWAPAASSDGLPKFDLLHHGILVARGPELHTDELVHGAQATDLCPTVLAILGLSISPGLDGVVLPIFGRDCSIRRAQTSALDHSSLAPPEPAPVQRSDAAPTRIDEDYMDWLADEGYARLKLEPMVAARRQIMAEAAAGLAVALRDRGNLRRAIAVLVPWVERCPEYSAARALLAELLWSLADTNECARVLAPLLERMTPHWRSFASALLLGAQSRWQEAETLLTSLADREPAFNPAAVALGWRRLAQRRWPEAEQLFRGVLSRAETDARVTEGLAIALLFQGRRREAEWWLNGALGREFADSSLHVLRGIAGAASGEPGETATTMTDCLPDMPPYLARLYAELTASRLAAAG